MTTKTRLHIQFISRLIIDILVRSLELPAEELVHRSLLLQLVHVFLLRVECALVPAIPVVPCADIGGIKVFSDATNTTTVYDSMQTKAIVPLMRVMYPVNVENGVPTKVCALAHTTCSIMPK